LETDPTVSPVQMPLRRLQIGNRDKYIYRVAIQISLQTTEAALDFRFDHFIVIILVSIGQKFAVDKMNMAKTAVFTQRLRRAGPSAGPWARAHLAHA